MESQSFAVGLGDGSGESITVLESDLIPETRGSEAQNH